jgi:hypothetical protein
MNTKGHRVVVSIRKDPETGEVLGPGVRGVTNREFLLDDQINLIKEGVSTLFQQKEDVVNAALSDIEQDVVALVAKVKRYLEGAK